MAYCWGIDPILDMGRTAVNVAGQALIPTIVAKRQGILDEALYNAPRSSEPFNDDSDVPVPRESEVSVPRELADARSKG